MKNIVFTIKTWEGCSNYFMEIDEQHSTEMQIEDALAEICFCDAYEVVSYKEVDKKYQEDRNSLIAQYEQLFGETVEDAFCSGKYTTLEAIKDDIEWKK